MILELNGKTFEVDFFDVEVLDGYTKALEPLKKANIQKKDNFSEFIKEYCGIVYHFFDTFLGAGTATKLFDGKNNLKVCNDCLQKCIVDCNDYLKNDFNKEFEATIGSWKDLIK